MVGRLRLRKEPEQVGGSPLSAGMAYDGFEFGKGKGSYLS